MGYTTIFRGQFKLNRPLTSEQAAYLTRFSQTRRMKRIQIMLNDAPDPLRTDVGLPLGIEGEYFTGAEDEDGQDFDHPSVIDDSEPPETQPSLWCDWKPTSDRQGIEWNGREKFYQYHEWFYYVIHHFLKPWGYTLSGTVQWRGDDRQDRGTITVAGNRILDFVPLPKGES